MSRAQEGTWSSRRNFCKHVLAMVPIQNLQPKAHVLRSAVLCESQRERERDFLKGSRGWAKSAASLLCLATLCDISSHGLVSLKWLQKQRLITRKCYFFAPGDYHLAAEGLLFPRKAPATHCLRNFCKLVLSMVPSENLQPKVHFLRAQQLFVNVREG